MSQQIRKMCLAEGANSKTRHDRTGLEDADGPLPLKIRMEWLVPDMSLETSIEARNESVVAALLQSQCQTLGPRSSTFNTFFSCLDSQNTGGQWNCSDNLQ